MCFPLQTQKREQGGSSGSSDEGSRDVEGAVINELCQIYLSVPFISIKAVY